jgi:hypothetical protein
MLRNRRAEIKLPPGAGAEITNCGSGFFLFIKDLKKCYRKKTMVAKEVFCRVNSSNFNPICVQHASIHVKKYWYSSQKKIIVKLSNKFIQSRGWSWSRRRKKYFRVRTIAKWGVA